MSSANFADAFVISNERLKVEIARPRTYYRGTRFDATGFITQVTLDGKHTFCMPESLVPGRGTGGAGLCNEFGISRAIGYEEIKPGEWFPKPGVGLLKRNSEEPYFFAGSFEMIPFPVETDINNGKAVFKCLPIECNGYAMELEKILSLEDNCLTIDYRLDNKGVKSISTDEYCHNFIGIDHHLVGREYCLILPYAVAEDHSPTAEGLLFGGNQIKWKGPVSKDFYCLLNGFEKGKMRSWELVHVPTNVGVKGFSDQPASRVALWGTTHVISPEVFIDIDLLPGKIFSWSRKYQFFGG